MKNHATHNRDARSRSSPSLSLPTVVGVSGAVAAAAGKAGWLMALSTSVGSECAETKAGVRPGKCDAVVPSETSRAAACSRSPLRPGADSGAPACVGLGGWLLAPGLCVGAKAVLEVEAITCVERNDPASEAVAASVAGGRGVVSGCAAAEDQPRFVRSRATSDAVRQQRAYRRTSGTGMGKQDD